MRRSALSVVWHQAVSRNASGAARGALGLGPQSTARPSLWDAGSGSSVLAGRREGLVRAACGPDQSGHVGQSCPLTQVSLGADDGLHEAPAELGG